MRIGDRAQPSIFNSPFPACPPNFPPLTSRTAAWLVGAFVLDEWKQAGLQIETAVKRGIYTVEESLVVKSIGQLTNADSGSLESSIKQWLGINCNPTTEYAEIVLV